MTIDDQLHIEKSHAAEADHSGRLMLFNLRNIAKCFSIHHLLTSTSSQRRLPHPPGTTHFHRKRHDHSFPLLSHPRFRSLTTTHHRCTAYTIVAPPTPRPIPPKYFLDCLIRNHTYFKYHAKNLLNLMFDTTIPGASFTMHITKAQNYSRIPSTDDLSISNSTTKHSHVLYVFSSLIHFSTISACSLYPLIGQPSAAPSRT